MLLVLVLAIVLSHSCAGLKAAWLVDAFCRPWWRDRRGIGDIEAEIEEKIGEKTGEERCEGERETAIYRICSCKRNAQGNEKNPLMCFRSHLCCECTVVTDSGPLAGGAAFGFRADPSRR
jgi:hypothetical protein